MVKTGTRTFPARGQFLEFWRKGVLKFTFLISRLFTNVLEQWLKGKYHFITDENNCSCAVESEACRLSMCNRSLYEKVAELPFQSTSVKGKPQKVTFQRTQHNFEAKFLVPDGRIYSSRLWHRVVVPIRQPM